MHAHLCIYLCYHLLRVKLSFKKQQKKKKHVCSAEAFFYDASVKLNKTLMARNYLKLQSPFILNLSSISLIHNYLKTIYYTPLQDGQSDSAHLNPSKVFKRSI